VGSICLICVVGKIQVDFDGLLRRARCPIRVIKFIPEKNKRGVRYVQREI
jgi:hypothetical protein